MLRHLAKSNRMNYFERDMQKISSLSHVEKMFSKIRNCKPCILHLRNIKSLVLISKNNPREGDDGSHALVSPLQQLLRCF